MRLGAAAGVDEAAEASLVNPSDSRKGRAMVAVLLRRKVRREVEGFMEMGLLGLERFRLHEGVDEEIHVEVAGAGVFEHGVG